MSYILGTKTDVCNIVWEAVMKTIAKKNCKKGKWLSEKGFLIAE